MKTYTQQEYNAMPVIEKHKLCPTGDYTAIKLFEPYSVFADGCIFGPDSMFGDYNTPNNNSPLLEYDCIFGEYCKFGGGCMFAEGCKFGRGCRFADNCKFEPDCDFAIHCILGAECVIGSNAVVAPCCVFNTGCIFGLRCKFASDIIFGPDCVFEHVYKAKPGHPMLAISGAGNFNRTTYFFNTAEGIIVRSGCFSGTLSQFRDRVKKECVAKGNETKELQYLGFANIVAATWAPELIEGEMK